MIRFASLVAAGSTTAAVAIAALAPVAAIAQGTSYYSATPVATPAKPLVITSGIVWKWADTSFVASQSTQRDAITCQMIAGATGKLSAFIAAGKSFDEASLAKCNARAK